MSKPEIKFKQIIKDLKTAFRLFPKSYKLVLDNFKLFAIINSFPLLITFLGVLNNKTDENSFNFTGSSNLDIAKVLGVGAGLAAVLLVGSILFQVMSYRLVLDVAAEKKTSFSRLWDFAKEYFFSLIGLGLIAVGVLMAVTLLIVGILVAILSILNLQILGAIIGGIVLFIIVIRLIANYYLAPFAMIDKKLGIYESFSASKAMSQKNQILVLSVVFVTILIGIVPTFAGKFGEILSALLAIAYSVAPAILYIDLKKKHIK